MSKPKKVGLAGLIAAHREGQPGQDVAEETQNLSSEETQKLRTSKVSQPRTSQPRAVKAEKPARVVAAKPAKIAPVTAVSSSVEVLKNLENSELKPFGTNLHPDLIRRLKMRAAADGRKVQEIIAEVLEEYLRA